MRPNGGKARPLVRVVIALSACVAFAALTYAVLTDGVLVSFDARTVAWAHVHQREGVTVFMEWASRSGGPSATSVYAAIVVVVCLLRHRLTTALGVAGVVYGGAALNVAIKYLVQRERPVVADPLMALPTYSFPSGHAAAITVFGGLVLTVALRHIANIRSYALTTCVIATWIVCVCVSRVYLGLHYPTDVLAGVLEGIAWLMVGSLALEHWRVPLTWPQGDAREP